MTAKQQPGESPGHYTNRELSWLAFNERVLEEAQDASNPLLERVRFATIVASNLDEFFMVRVAALKQAVQEGDSRPDPAGLSPERQLAAIAARATVQVERLDALVTTVLLPALAANGIGILELDALDASARAAVAAYFQSEVLPALTPLAIDLERPFPMLATLSLNLAFWLAPATDGEARRLAVVQLPAGLPRLVRVSGTEGPTFVWLESILRAESAALFPGQAVVESTAFRVTRDSELELDDEGGESFLEAVEQSLRQRRRNDAVRLEVEASASDEAVARLMSLVEVSSQDVYRRSGPLDLRALATVMDLPGFEVLRFPALPPVQAVPPEEDVLLL